LHLNIEQYEQEKEAKILKQLEQLKVELEPMEKVRKELAEQAKKHTNRMIWLGLGLMSIQAGVLARLTWFDYSWDIVEPISYFVSYSAVIGVYAYFVLTRKVIYFFYFIYN
jgi:calcium uniporter protein, mitochondrial